MTDGRRVSSELSVGGMDRASWANAIEAALKQLEGVKDLRVDEMLTIRWMLLALLILTGGACRRAGDDAPRDTTGRRDADPSIADMPGMRSGAAEGGSAQTMAAMEIHLRHMQNATASELKTRLPLHRPTVANMIAQLDREMRDMNMPADTAWNAALDSLRQDLRVMPDLSAEGLRDLMPAHATRVRRVLDMHRSMMANMRH